MMSDPILAAWAVTATAAAIYYARGESKFKHHHIWAIKMLIKMANNKATITRQGDVITFHYEDDREENTIRIGVK